MPPLPPPDTGFENVPSQGPSQGPGAGPGLGLSALASKLSPPRVSASQVPREAICQAIADARGARLVLVRAPAGFGKTTTLVQAQARLAASGLDTAWLTLDRADNDVPRFLACLQQAVAPLLAEHPPAGADPLAVLDALARQGAPFALFLDDFELISEPAVLGLVRELIDHLPRGGQLVLGSRSLPDLGLGRLRAAGQLLEIDAEPLRFSLAEAQQYFALRHGTAAGPAGAAPSELQAHLPELLRKTEGWIAALWLASMALDGVIRRQGSVAGFIAQFSGSNRAVADFLAEDVLARQPPEIRDFLLRTSILRHLNPPLCQVLMPRANAARMLADLDAANLFITPVGGADGPAGRAGDAREWPELPEWPEWRYHSLFADFLRQRLAQQMPEDMARLHLAASGWYEAQGRPVPAIDHAIEGGDLPHAVDLLARHAISFLEQGRMRLLSRWFDALPAALLHARPLLQVVALWACTLTRGPWQAMALLRSSGCAEHTDAAVQAHVRALQPMLLAMMDRVDEASAIGQAPLAGLPSGQPFADSVLCNAMAYAMGVMGQRERALGLLDAARRGQQGAGFNRMYSESIEGLLDLQQGRLRQATARFRLAVGTPAGGAAAGAAFPPSHGNAWAGVLYAGAMYETHQLALAEHLLNVYLPLARDVGLPDHMILSHAMRSRIAFLRGEVDAALNTLAELEYLGHQRQLPRVVASARLERAQLLMRQGQAEPAAAALARADDPAVWQRVAQLQLTAHDVDDLQIGRLRWQALFGDAAAAALAAGQAADAARAAQRQRRALKLQLLQALAWQRAGAVPVASALLLQLLPQVQAEGFVRLLLDEGPDIGSLLRRARRSRAEQVASGAARADPLQDDHLQRLLALAPDDPGPDLDAGLGLDSAAPAQAGPSLNPREPLTHKETRVLQLLAEGYSNGAMADKLFVSDSTVRTHLRNINQKLGAHSRTQAVAIARRLRVIG